MAEGIRKCFSTEYKRIERLNKSINDKESTLAMLLKMSSHVQNLE